MSNATVCEPTTPTLSSIEVVSQFLSLLEQAGGVVIDDTGLITNWETSSAEDRPDNEVVRFKWQDDGQDYSVVLNEGAIAHGVWVGNYFFCEDLEGQDTQLTLYSLVPLTPVSSEI